MVVRNEVVTTQPELTKQPETPQGLQTHQVRIIDDDGEHFAGVIDLGGLLDESGFAFEVAPVSVDLKCLAQDAQRGVIRVQGSIYDRRDRALCVMPANRLFEHALTGSRFTDDRTKSALLAVHAKRIEDFLLLVKERKALVGEGCFVDSKVRADHDAASTSFDFGLRSFAVKLLTDITSGGRFDAVDFDVDFHVDIAKVDQNGRTRVFA